MPSSAPAIVPSDVTVGETDGDEPGTDLAGAQNAKVTGIWMNRRGQTADPVIAHHAEIRNMTELLTLLGLS